jgi:tetratricopeptide (TPR) repeat protein
VKPGLIVSVAAILLALFAVDQFLARLQNRELGNEAQSLYAYGDRLLAEGRADDALVRLQRAHTLARDNRTYPLALARALVATGRLGEAESSLRDLLDRDSNYGETNLIMARLMVRESNSTEADAYYHRALYGRWPAGSNQANVRMELIDFLARRGARQELLPELLLLQNETGAAPADVKVAGLFLMAGSPNRAADAYRDLIRRNPDDVELYRGLGEAELAQGDFHRAQANFVEALRRKPGDPDIIQRLQFTTMLSSLDPTPRRAGCRRERNSNEAPGFWNWPKRMRSSAESRRRRRCGR